MQHQQSIAFLGPHDVNGGEGFVAAGPGARSSDRLVASENRARWIRPKGLASVRPLIDEIGIGVGCGGTEMVPLACGGPVVPSDLPDRIPLCDPPGSGLSRLDG